jgi:phage terminase large subunit
LDTRPTLGPTLKAAQKLLDAHRAATSGGVEVLWQHLGELVGQFEVRVDTARRALVHTRLLVVVCVSGMYTSDAGIVVVDLPPKHFAALHPSNRDRYVVLRGGRGSAKSWSIARVLVVTALERRHRIGCFREFQKSIAESAHRLLADTIDSLGLGRFFNVLMHTITAANGSEFLFEGLWANVQKIKSLEGITIAWVEEAARVSDNSWTVLIPTIRTPRSRIFVNFNPESEDDATYERFVVSPPPHSTVVNVTWEDNPYFPIELEREREYLARVDPDAHAHVWGGACMKHSDAQILARKYTIEAFEPQPQWDGPYFGADWGFANDPTTLVRCWIADRRLYVEYEAYAVGCDIDRTPALFDLVRGAREHVIRADCARPETNSYMVQHGFPNLVGVEKWSGSVEDGIAFLRSFEQIIVHPRCTHTAEECRLYSYRIDRVTGDVMPDAKDANNHCIDALRYALQPLIQGRGAAALMAFYATDETKRKAALAAAAAGDAHHKVERTFLGLPAPSPPLLPFQRAKAQGGKVGDL